MQCRLVAVQCRRAQQPLTSAMSLHFKPNVQGRGYLNVMLRNVTTTCLDCLRICPHQPRNIRKVPLGYVFLTQVQTRFEILVGLSVCVCKLQLTTACPILTTICCVLHMRGNGRYRGPLEIEFGLWTNSWRCCSKVCRNFSYEKFWPFLGSHVKHWEAIGASLLDIIGNSRRAMVCKFAQ